MSDKKPDKCQKCGQEARKLFPVNEKGMITLKSQAKAYACSKCVKG